MFPGDLKEKDTSLPENIFTNEAYSLSLKEGKSVNKSPFLLSNQVRRVKHRQPQHKPCRARLHDKYN